MSLGNFGFPLGYSEKKKTPVKKREYHSRKEVLAIHGNKCKICDKTEKQVGKLELAHYKAHSRGGKEVVPLCPTCHTRYDNGLLTIRELKKLNLTKEEYLKNLPKQKTMKRKRTQKPTSPEESYKKWAEKLMLGKQ